MERQPARAVGRRRPAWGIGVKESGNLKVDRQPLRRRSRPASTSTPPRSRSTTRTASSGNVIAFCEAGDGLPRQRRRATRSSDNRFRDNRVDVRVEGGGDATRVRWSGNYFDDYGGYDLDGDGTATSLTSCGASRPRPWAAHPDLAYFRGDPGAWSLVDAVERRSCRCSGAQDDPRGPRAPHGAAPTQFESGRCALSCARSRSAFGEMTALEGLTLDPRPAAGKWRSIGPNGSGKSTLTRVLHGPARCRGRGAPRRSLPASRTASSSRPG